MSETLLALRSDTRAYYIDLSDPNSPRLNPSNNIPSQEETKEIIWKDRLVIGLRIFLPMIALATTIGPSYGFNDNTGCMHRAIRITCAIIAVTSIFFSALLNGYNICIVCEAIDWTCLKDCRPLLSFVSLCILFVAAVFGGSEIVALGKCL